MIDDELALAQSPVEEEDLIVHILGQLGEDYAHISGALKSEIPPSNSLISLTNLLIMNAHSRKPNQPYSSPLSTTRRNSNKGTDQRIPTSIAMTADHQTGSTTMDLDTLVLKDHPMVTMVLSMVIAAHLTINIAIFLAMILKNVGN